MDIHNIANWNNAALATLALALGDDALLDTELHGSAGLRAQLIHGIRADGFWWEGSPSYHYYTLAALIWTMRVLRASGRAFDDEGALHRMFRAPIAIAFPDLSLPAIHDCWYPIGLNGAVGHGIPDAAGYYEVLTDGMPIRTSLGYLRRITPSGGVRLSRPCWMGQAFCLTRPDRPMRAIMPQTRGW